MIKNVQHFRIKWVAISNQGSTWEPRSHIVGADAEKILNLYLENKKALLAADLKRKEDILAGVLVNTGKPPEVIDLSNDNPTQGKTRFRVNSSPFKDHFSDWY